MLCHIFSSEELVFFQLFRIEFFSNKTHDPRLLNSKNTLEKKMSWPRISLIVGKMYESMSRELCIIKTCFIFLK